MRWRRTAGTAGTWFRATSMTPVTRATLSTHTHTPNLHPTSIPVHHYSAIPPPSQSQSQSQSHHGHTSYRPPPFPFFHSRTWGFLTTLAVSARRSRFTGTVTSARRDGEALWVTIEVPERLLKYIVKKGYIAIDGIPWLPLCFLPSRFPCPEARDTRVHMCSAAGKRLLDVATSSPPSRFHALVLLLFILLHYPPPPPLPPRTRGLCNHQQSPQTTDRHELDGLRGGPQPGAV